MARHFTTAGSDKLRTTTLPIASGTPPFTMACWFNPDNTTADQYLMSMSDEATANNYHILYMRNADSNHLTSHSRAGADSAYNGTTAAPTASTWNHACGVWSSTSARAVYLNGTNKGSQTSVTVTPAGLDNFVIGALDRSASDVFSDCSIAEAAIWSVALTDAEVALLATGISPLAVRPASLVSYWPLIGRYSPEIDIKARNELTVTGTTTANHTRVFYPKKTSLFAIFHSASVSITGAVATASSNAIAGVLSALRIVGITGQTSVANADAKSGVFQEFISITGVPSVATADAKAGTVTTVNIVSVTGDIATATADAKVGTITALHQIVGVVATATANVISGVVSAIRIKSVTGTPATATADTKAPSISAIRIATITGAIAIATATAKIGVITAVQGPAKLFQYLVKIPDFRYQSKMPSYLGSNSLTSFKYMVSLPISKVVTAVSDFKKHITIGSK